MSAEYLSDTVTIIRYFSKAGRIGKKAKEILNGAEKGDYRIYISVITIVEIMYLSQKRRIRINLKDTIDLIGESANYSIVDLTPEIVMTSENVPFPELLDRLIMSTAKHLALPMLTCDKKIREAGIIETIWN